MAKRTTRILLIEDNQGDARLTQELLNESKVGSVLHIVKDGMAAMDYFRKQDSNSPYPDLILLDLNIPKKDGRELLRELKEDPELRHIPVIVLTTSDRDEDILYCYQNHAACYITKPIDLGQFTNVMKAIEAFWLGVAKLPGQLPSRRQLPLAPLVD